MAVTNTDITYTNGNSGRTRINAAGAIVGVDFSNTSNPIATGPKTFTLTATANLNRDWVVGSAVVAVAQAGATGSLIGTVTTYTPSTQSLTIEVASITGSGTGTEWRIGSTGFRTAHYDPVTFENRGQLIEGVATNLVFPSAAGATQTRTVVAGTTYTLSFWGTGSVTLTGASTGAFTGNGAFPAARKTQTFIATTASLTLTVSGTVTDWQLEAGGAATSLIPTTTLAVSRAADQASITGTKFTDAFGSAGTIVLELTPIASAVSAVAGSLNDGTAANAIRIVQKQTGTLSSIRKMATDGVTDVMALNNSVNNTLVSNGVDHTEVATQSANAQFAVASSAVGSFLSVGASENFRNTNDSGLTYNARTIGGTFSGAYFGISRWVIAGSTSVINGATVGSVITSTDGLAFRRFNIAGLTQNLTEITSNGVDQYVAVGAGGVIYTSHESQNWTPQTSGVATAFNAVDFGGGKYVAVNATAANSRYSTNGTTWTAITGLTGTMTDVKWTGSQWVAVNTIGGVFTSADGITFAAVSTTGISPAFTAAQGITFGNGYYVIVGNGGQVAVCTAAAGASPATWVTYTNGGSPSTGTSQQLNEVLLFGTKFYIGGNGSTIVEFDLVGITFTSRNGAHFNGNVTGFASSGSRLLLSGSNSSIATTDDGASYVSRTGNAQTLNGAAFGAGTYVIVGNAANGSGLIATINPTTFEYQRRVSGFAGVASNVKFLNGRFVVVGANAIANSVAGDSYTTVAVTGTYFSVAYNGTTYVAVGSTGRIGTSTDLASFTVTASQLGAGNVNDVEWAGGVFVAVNAAGEIYTSATGLAGSWTLRTSGISTALYTVSYSTRDQQWYAAGDNGTILRATDPTGTWTSIANDATVGVFTAGVLQAHPLAGKLTTGVKNRIAIGWDSTGVEISINGADPVLDGSVSPPTLSQFTLGMSGLAANHWNSTIKTQKAYRTRVPSAELQALGRI